MNYRESINMAFVSISSNKLRAGLTLLSISIGVFAIVGIAAAVSSLDGQINTTLSQFGQNAFQIQKRPAISFGDDWRRFRNRKDITLRQAFNLKKKLTTAKSIVFSKTTFGVTAKYGEIETNPNVNLIGTNEYYIPSLDYKLTSGRGISEADVDIKSKVVVLGTDIVKKIFPNTNPLGKTISLNNIRYLVIGVLESKGTTFGQSQDNILITPITSAAIDFFDEWNNSVNLSIRSYSMEDLNNVIDQSVMLMRVLRNVPIGEPNDFEIITNENISETFSNMTNYIQQFGLACGGIALLAAGIGIMNIMLVNAKERTREIGIRKALGATSTNILTQFLIEAITLCQLGAIMGIIPGLIAGIGISVFESGYIITLDTNFCFYFSMYFDWCYFWWLSCLESI